MTSTREGESIQDKIERYLSPKRLEELDPFFIMAFLPIEPHQHVADIGCGPGFFSIPLAKHLVYGKLYCLDIEEEMLKVLRQRVDDVKLANVEIIKCKEAEFPLPNGSLDGVFLAFVLHHNEDRVGFLNSAGALLKPKGWCAVLDWFPKETEGGPPVQRRVSPDDLRKLAEKAGMEFRWWRELNPKHYMALLRR